MQARLEELFASPLGSDLVCDLEEELSNLNPDLGVDFLELAMQKAIERAYPVKTILNIISVIDNHGEKTGRYAQWIELVAMYGKEDLFECMVEMIADGDAWFYLRIFSSALEVSKDRLEELITWLDKQGCDLKEILDTCVGDINFGGEVYQEEKVTVLALAVYLDLDLFAQPWANDGRAVSKWLDTLKEGV